MILAWLAGRPVIQRAGEILAQLEAEAADGRNATPSSAWQLRPFADEWTLIEEKEEMTDKEGNIIH